MKSLFIIVAVVVCVQSLETKLDEKWTLFVKEHNKLYRNKAEESFRRVTWENNLKFIQKHNDEADKGLHTFKLEMNRFGDMVKFLFILILKTILIIFFKEFN